VDRIRGLSLFSGIGGIDIALSPWVRTVAYCEIDQYSQATLMSRMRSGEIDRAPIFTDVSMLNKGGELEAAGIEILHGGFP